MIEYLQLVAEGEPEFAALLSGGASRPIEEKNHEDEDEGAWEEVDDLEEGKKMEMEKEKTTVDGVVEGDV